MLRSGFHQHAIGAIFAAWFNSIGVLFGAFSPSSGAVRRDSPMRRFRLFDYSLLFVVTIVPTQMRKDLPSQPFPRQRMRRLGCLWNQPAGCSHRGGGFRAGHLCLLYTDNHVKPICSLVNGQGGAAGGINDFRQIAGGSDNHGFIWSRPERRFT